MVSNNHGNLTRVPEITCLRRKKKFGDSKPAKQLLSTATSDFTVLKVSDSVYELHNNYGTVLLRYKDIFGVNLIQVTTNLILCCDHQRF